MPGQTPPLLPTTVIGSYAIPSWLWTALEEIKKGNYGVTDQKETIDDAVNMAIRDQERAGVDIITDGEMRRWYFVQGFYQRFKGLEPIEPLRKTGVYGYDSPLRWRPVERIVAPEGLGIEAEFRYAKENTDRPLKATCPGPLTLTIHIQLRDKKIYKDRLELAHEVAGTINTELKALVEAGADYIQLDEPSFAIIPGSTGDWVDLYNRSVEGVKARLALHICFGNLSSRPRGKRQYRWMFPEIMDANCDELVFEFANREMKEIELVKEIASAKKVGLGVVDVKSFYVEPPEEVAERIREALQYVAPEKAIVSPDCGFFQLPRWLAFLKLKAMVEGTKIVRKELTG